MTNEATTRTLCVFGLAALLTACRTSQPPDLSAPEEELPPLEISSVPDVVPSTAKKVKPTQETTLPVQWARALLPADGEIISEILRRNVWPQNSEAFLKHEMLEFSLGVGIRAKKGDRDNQRSLTPSVVFEDGYVTLKGGWRAHKRVPGHTDLFDGTAVGTAFIAYAGGETVFDSAFTLDWNESMAARLLLGIGDIAEMVLMDILEGKLEKQIEEKAPDELSKKIEQFLKENKLPLGIKKNLYADITKEGMRIRLYDYDLNIRSARVPKFDFRLKKVRNEGGDGDFGGHGPRVNLAARIQQKEQKLVMTLAMSARETEDDGTFGRNSQELDLFTIPPGEQFVDVVGGTKVQLLKDFVMKGHDRLIVRTQLGHLHMVGDTEHDDDVPKRSGIKLVQPKLVHIITMKKPR